MWLDPITALIDDDYQILAGRKDISTKISHLQHIFAVFGICTNLQFLKPDCLLISRSDTHKFTL